MKAWKLLMNKELRKYVRVSIMAPLYARLSPGLSAENCFCRLNGQLFDDYLKRSLYKRICISGSGMAFESDVPFAPGGILEVRFALDDIYPGVIELCLEVLRVDMRPRCYCIVGKYLGMDERVRKLIVQFTSEREQRAGRKKITK
jgi:hypothetical protein